MGVRARRMGEVADGAFQVGVAVIEILVHAEVVEARVEGKVVGAAAGETAEG